MTNLMAVGKLLELPSADALYYTHCGPCQQTQPTRSYVRATLDGMEDPRCTVCGTVSHTPCQYVYEILDAKRRTPEYPILLASVRQNGFKTPIYIEDGWVSEGHHRIAVAEDLGHEYMEWTDDAMVGFKEWDWRSA